MRTQAFQIGDVEGMVAAAVADAKTGANVYIETRTVRPGLPRERGKINATIAVGQVGDDAPA
jgi:hypothetical protein